MPRRVLRNLKITEISSVDKGAGDGVQIVLMKRHDDDETPLGRRLRKIFSQGHFSKKRRAFGNDDHTDHSPTGRQLAEHLSNHITKEEKPMSRIEKLQAIAKQHGVRNIAKLISDEIDAQGISEHEFTALMMDEAARQGMSFEKYFSAPEQLGVRKAHQLTKSTPVAKETLLRPVEVKPVVSDSDSEEAYRQLQAMAEQLAAAGKYRSVASAFAAVFEDQANAALAAKAHRRPSPMTNYPHPTR